MTALLSGGEGDGVPESANGALVAAGGQESHSHPLCLSLSHTHTHTHTHAHTHTNMLMDYSKVDILGSPYKLVNFRAGREGGGIPE